jgi:4-hydroxy-tetrahydrodipicolinate reductase
MGREISAMAEADPAFTVTARMGHRRDSWAFDAGDVDVVIEFSSPAGLSQALSWCVRHRKPLVAGTTGLGAGDKAKLKAAARRIPVLYSANMSRGIALMTSMLESFGATADWDFQIDEVHHGRKKDRPSGTALLLDDKLAQAIGRRPPRPNSIRGGGIPGIHQIWALGPDEMVVLQHTAFNRRVFAGGALSAARWLFDKKRPGLYDLSDLYKMRS